VLVAGEETNESLSNWPRAAAAQQSSESERVASERERDRTRREEACSRRKGKQVMHRRRKKTHGLLVGRFFSFFENLCFFSFPPF